MLGDLNTTIFNSLRSLAQGPALLRDFGVVVADYLPYLMVLLFLGLIATDEGKRKRFILLACALIAMVISRGIITEWMHVLITSPRPFAALGFQPLVPESGNSFPSGHAAFLFALSGSLFPYKKSWSIVFSLLSLANGVARVAVGVHWPTDILAGILVGYLGAFIAWRLVGASYRAVVAENNHTS